MDDVALRRRCRGGRRRRGCRDRDRRRCGRRRLGGRRRDGSGAGVSALGGGAGVAAATTGGGSGLAAGVAAGAVAGGVSAFAGVAALAAGAGVVALPLGESIRCSASATDRFGAGGGADGAALIAVLAGGSAFAAAAAGAATGASTLAAGGTFAGGSVFAGAMASVSALPGVAPAAGADFAAVVAGEASSPDSLADETAVRRRAESSPRRLHPAAWVPFPAASAAAHAAASASTNGADEPAAGPAFQFVDGEVRECRRLRSAMRGREANVAAARSAGDAAAQRSQRRGNGEEGSEHDDSISFVGARLAPRPDSADADVGGDARSSAAATPARGERRAAASAASAPRGPGSGATCQRSTRPAAAPRCHAGDDPCRRAFRTPRWCAGESPSSRARRRAQRAACGLCATSRTIAGRPGSTWRRAGELDR